MGPTACFAVREMGNLRTRTCLVEEKTSQPAPSGMTWSSRLSAANSSAWRMSSSSSSGYSELKSSRLGYKATASTTRRTVSRIPRMVGCPFITSGLEVIRSYFVAQVLSPRPKSCKYDACAHLTMNLVNVFAGDHPQACGKIILPMTTLASTLKPSTRRLATTALMIPAVPLNTLIRKNDSAIASRYARERTSEAVLL